MEIWLKNTEEDAVRLPILPPSFEITDAHSNTSITVHNVGEVNLLGKPALLVTELSAFWPAHEYSFCQYTGFMEPYEFVSKIREWKKDNITPRLIITGTDINTPVSIESFRYGEKDGTGDLEYTLSLKEYIAVGYEVKQESASTGSSTSTSSKFNSTPAPATKKTASKSKKTSKTKYVVKKGDTLEKIAKKILKKSSYASKIYKENKTVIEKAAKKHGKKSSKKGWWIYPGTTLWITK